MSTSTSSYNLRSRKKNVGPSTAGVPPQAGGHGGNVNEIESVAGNPPEIENVAGNPPEIENVAGNPPEIEAAEDNGTPLFATGNPPNNTKRAILIKFWMAMAYASMFWMLFSLKHTHIYEKLKFALPNYSSELMAFGMGCAFVVSGLHRLSRKINFSLGAKTKYILKFGIDCTMLYRCVKLNQFMHDDIWGFLVVFNLSLHIVAVCQTLRTSEDFGIVDAFVAVCMSIGMHLKNHNSWTKPVVISACILLTAVKDLNPIQRQYNLLKIHVKQEQGDDNQQHGNVNMV